MNSIRTRVILLTASAIVASMLVATFLGIFAIRNIGNEDSDQMLYLLGEVGQKNLDSYFGSVEQAVGTVSAYVETDLKDVPSDQIEDELAGHLDRVEEFFGRMARGANGVLTYYYRLDPDFTQTQTGFWFVNLDGNGFQEHEPTDISKYDQQDTSSLVWYTVPKATGNPIWLPPYVTDNLGARVISYNVPVYYDERFIGVIGIELDYSTMAEQVDNIKLYENGYAFINDAEGNILYHPRMDVMHMDEKPNVPDGLLGDGPFVYYTYEGVQKEAVWMPLENGARLNVTVPVAEMNARWFTWVYQFAFFSFVLLVVFILISMRFAQRITKPLLDLTRVAQRVNEGDYDCTLDYRGNDEVGVLTSAFNNLIANLRRHIGNLSNLAYSDALTHVRNKGAFEISTGELQAQIEEGDSGLEFGICVFDCNDLKEMNDRYGHEKGDLYLKAACALICEIFDHSPVFRIGGDEFAVILKGSDYRNREKLIESFDEACARSREQEDDPWERLSVARGVAVYDPQEDDTANEVVRRADRLMYEHKWKGKGLGAE